MTTAARRMISRHRTIRDLRVRPSALVLLRMAFAIALVLALVAPARSVVQDPRRGADLVGAQFLGVQGWLPAAWVPVEETVAGYPERNHPELRRRFELPGEAGAAELHIDARNSDARVLAAGARRGRRRG